LPCLLYFLSRKQIQPAASSVGFFPYFKPPGKRLSGSSDA
jgi:hypothetical protein